MKKILIKLIRFYQKLPLNSHGYCKFIPSCSSYAIDAIEEYGALRGTLMSIYRVLRCNPFNKGGSDPVRRRK